MGLFRSPRSRPGALVRRKAGSAHQTDRITSLVSKWGCSAHQGASQVALVRRKAGSAHQTDRITSLVSKWGCSAHERAGQVALVRRKAGSTHQTDRITSLVSKWGCSAHQGAGQVLWCAGRPIPLTKSNRCGHGRSAVGNGQLAAGSGERAAGSKERAAGSGERAAGSKERAAGSGERAASSGERTGRRNRLRKGSAAKALIIQHLNADNCLQIRIILTTIAKNCRRQDRGKVVADQHYFGFPPTRYKLKFNKNVLIL